MCDRSDDFPELSDAQKAGWQAAVSDIREMSAGLRDGTATREDMEGAAPQWNRHTSQSVTPDQRGWQCDRHGNRRAGSAAR
jgi:hypothetical protein